MYVDKTSKIKIFLMMIPWIGSTRAWFGGQEDGELLTKNLIAAVCLLWYCAAGIGVSKVCDSGTNKFL